MQARLTLCLMLAIAPTTLCAGPIAEVVCAPRAEMVERLTRSYGANLAASGLRDIETVVEVWASPRGDWTLVQTGTTGQSCILAMGEAWDMPSPPGSG